MELKPFYYRMKPIRCPQCGKKLEAGTKCNENEKPDPGDFAICIYCATILRYNDDMNLRIATGDELVEYGAQSPLALALLIKTRMVVRRHLIEKALLN